MFSRNFHDHFQLYMYTNDVYFWQHEKDIFTYLFQPSGANLLQRSHGNFQPYSMGYNTYSFEHLELFYEG
jgi:hypothetical protein